METHAQVDTITRKIARGGAISFTGQVFSTGARTVYHILLAKFLGSASYGIFSIGLGILNVTNVLAIMGLNLGGVRYIAIYKGENDYPRLKGIFVFSLVFVCLAASILGFILWNLADTMALLIFNERGLIFVIKLFAAALPFFSMTLIIASFFRGLQKLEYTALIQDMAQPLLAIILLLLFSLVGLDLNSALIAYLFSVTLCFAFALILLRKKGFPETSDARPRFEAKKWLVFSAPLVLLYFTIILMNKIDVFMLGSLRTSQEVGIYAAASRIAHLIFLFWVAFNSIFSPVFADLFHQKKLKELSKIFKIVTRWTFTFSLPFTMVIFFFNKELLMLFGSNFAEGGHVLRLLAVLWLLVSCCGSLGNILIMTGNRLSEVYLTVIPLVLNILLNYFFIKRWGIIGAALATALSLSIFNIIRMIYIYYKTKLQPFNRDFFKPILAVIPILVILNLVKNGSATHRFSVVLAWSLVAIILYFVLLYVLGLKEDDKKIVQSIVRRFTGHTVKEKI